jgi:hypothetical protein
MMYLTAGRDAARAIHDYSKKLMEIIMRISTTDHMPISYLNALEW